MEAELSKTEFVNAGVSGYGTDQELLWLETDEICHPYMNPTRIDKGWISIRRRQRLMFVGTWTGWLLLPAWAATNIKTLSLI